MRLYSASSEETLRARKPDGLVQLDLSPKEQYQRLEQETVSELRTTNGNFLRLVLFLFTLISVGAATALFFVVFVSRPSDQTVGVFSSHRLLRGCRSRRFRCRLYRYGIEEALAVCWGFLCGGMQLALFSSTLTRRSRMQPTPLFPRPAVFSLWIWRRFAHFSPR